MKIHKFKQFLLSKSNSFDQNFMKLLHIVYLHNVFFKFDNGLYRTMLSGVMTLCLWKFTVWNDVRSLSRIVLIKVLWNLVTLLRTIISSSSLKMVKIAPCFQELWPFVYEISLFQTMPALLAKKLWSEFYKSWSLCKYHNVFFKVDNGLYCTMLSGIMDLCLPFETMSAL